MKGIVGSSLALGFLVTLSLLAYKVAKYPARVLLVAGIVSFSLLTAWEFIAFYSGTQVPVLAIWIFFGAPVVMATILDILDKRKKQNCVEKNRMGKEVGSDSNSHRSD
ncbi:MAG: hypothetical protein ACREIS_01270 [Nitrospiraceae bacterium]